MKLLVAVDFSESTEKVLETAFRFAQRLQASVYLVHVADPEPDFVGYEAGPDEVRDQLAERYHAEHRALQDRAASFRDKGILTKGILAQGPTVKTLLKMADKVNSGLIVTGSHGRGMVTEILLGSVSSGLIKHAHCPVMVVPVK